MFFRSVSKIGLNEIVVLCGFYARYKCNIAVIEAELDIIGILNSKILVADIKFKI